MAAGLHIVAVGRLSPELAPVFEHYRRLLTRLVPFSVREVREVPLRNRTSEEVLREEGRRLLHLLEDETRCVVLDAGGRAFGSVALAEWIQGLLDSGGATFVLGGSLGLHEQVKTRAFESLSLSPLTLPHQLARVVLAEQLFRSLKIARGETYHH